MFPHTITIYHHSVVNGADVYSRTEVPGWYWMHTASGTGAGKGTEKTDTYKAVASQLTTSLYGDSWSVKVGDRVVKGPGPDITAWKDLKGDVMVVKAIEENICGSSVDNITLSG
jgi:hypothetical protein